MFECMKRPTRPSGSSQSAFEKARDYRFKNAIKLLLLGTGESGKTTFSKQMKILHINGFSDEEKREKIRFIKQNIHESIYDIVNNMDKISPPVGLHALENRVSLQYILAMGPDEPHSTQYTKEYFNHVKALWGDGGVQEAFRRSNEYALIDSAQYFLDRIDTISNSIYIPTLKDILYCRIKTVSISEIEFSVPVPKVFGGGQALFLLYDVGGQRGERKKWIQVFDGIHAILFVIAASDFDQNLREDDSKNRLVEAFTVFRDIYRSRFVRDAGFIVFLNKQDVLKKKLEQGRRIEQYFPDYQRYIPQERNVEAEYTQAKLFMKEWIVSISREEVRIEFYNPLTARTVQEVLPPREVYIHYTIATDTDNIKRIFDSVHEIIIRINTRDAFY